MNASPAAPLSSHVAALAGLDLPDHAPTVVRVLSAREVAVVRSRSRSAEREIFVDRCRADRVPIVVRPSGGGAVVLGPGVVTASVLDETGEGEIFPERHFRRFCGAVGRALGEIGVAAQQMGVSDLAVGDRKVAGTALRLWRGRVLFQVSLLVDIDVALIERYLRAPSREPDYRRQRNHREFLVTLREAGWSGELASLEKVLLETLSNVVRR